MRLPVLFAMLALNSAMNAVGDDGTVDLAGIDRGIVREPEYQSQPHYALFAFGPKAEHRAWFVIDGDAVAYIDRNGNGDLTEPEERVELDVAATNKLRLGGSGAYKAMHVFPLGEVFGTKLLFQLWVRNREFDASKDDFYRDHFGEMDARQWVNGSLMRSAADGSQSQNPLLLTVRAEDAQIVRFGGPITAGLKWDDRQKLEPWPKEFVFDVHLGYRNLPANGSHQGAFCMTRFTETEVPKSIVPIAAFEFTETSDGRPLSKTVRLDERCCGDTFYVRMTLPKEILGGKAKVVVRVQDWTGGGSEAAEFEIPVNQEISRDAEAVYVMFEKPDIELKHAVNALRKRGMDITIEPAGLMISENGRPKYSVQLARSAAVRQVADQLGVGTPHADVLRRCDVRFEIHIAEAEHALEDQSVLAEIQSALQALTGGYVYRTWERELVPPQKQ